MKVEDTFIDPFGATILAYKSGEQVLVKTEELKWNDDNDGYPDLTLKQIAEQLLEKGYEPVFDVWYEIGIRGYIYRYGNYTPEEWVEHGTTKGYA